MKTLQEITSDLKNRFGENTILVDIQDVSEVTGLSAGTIKNYINSGYLLPKHVKLGLGKNASIRFFLTELAYYLYSLQSREYKGGKDGTYNTNNS